MSVCSMRVHLVAAAARAALLAAIVLGGCDAPKKDEADDVERTQSRQGTLEKKSRGYLGTVVHARTIGQALKDRINAVRTLNALKAYAVTHGDRFPASLEDLAEDSPGMEGVLTAGGRQRFAYIAGLSPRDTSRAIIYETTIDQDGNRYVGRVNGSVELISDEALQAELGVAPGR